MIAKISAKRARKLGLLNRGVERRPGDGHETVLSVRFWIEEVRLDNDELAPRKAFERITERLAPRLWEWRRPPRWRGAHLKAALRISRELFEEALSRSHYSETSTFADETLIRAPTDRPS